MKKRILSLLAICCTFFVSTSGTNETNNNNNNTNEKVTVTAEDIGSVEGTKTIEGLGSVSIASYQNDGSKLPDYFSTSKCWRYYNDKSGNGNGNSMTINVTDKLRFSKISFTFTNKNYMDGWTTDTSGTSTIEGTVLTWTCEDGTPLQSITFKNTNTDISGKHVRIQSFTIGDDPKPTVSLSPANSVGGYYKDGSTKKQFVSFGARVTGTDLSVVSKYGINVYSNSTYSTLVASKSITIGEGGHTIDELIIQGGRFYTILSSDDGIVDKKIYYAKAFVEEASGATSYTSEVMKAKADTEGTEYIL